MDRPAAAHPVFISYARLSNRANAEALHLALGGPEGLAFLDRSDLEIGAQFPSEIGRALLASRVVVVLADETYFQRWYCLREFGLAVMPAATAYHDQNSLEHVVVGLSDSGAGTELASLPPSLRTTNWPRAADTEALVAMITTALSVSAKTLAERLGSSGSAALALLREQAAIPSPRALTGIPATPI